MRILSISKPAVFRDFHSQEDHFLISKRYPIFVVADGVTLNFDNGKDYSSASGAKEAAKIFCEAVVAQAEKMYENFKEWDISAIFEAGNTAVLKYNISQGRTKDTINYWDVDFFSATTSFLLIKDNKAYWWSLCDSGMIVFRNLEKIFQSPGGWINFPNDWSEKENKKAKVILRHRDYRNAVNEGKLIGYGAVTGEESAKLYLNTGVLDINLRDIIFLFTDGLENYFQSEKFIDIFKSWPEGIEEQLSDIIAEKSKAEPSKYGSEKTLIAISV